MKLTELTESLVKRMNQRKHFPLYGVGPIYVISMFMIVCIGAIFCANNLWLLILPIIYWISMTLLMKATEEKWLKDLYGDGYIEYCRNVNRCIPWFRKI
ncbi:MAG: isoprenylcysteine carboxylmethyltransferase family protein [Velocimicrobium sp.]